MKKGKVMVFGTFDNLHQGHKHFLMQAKKQGSYLTVVIARDATVLAVKWKKTRHDEKARLRNIKKLGIADKVILGNKGNKYAVIKKYHPQTICLGYDQIFFTHSLRKLFPNIQIYRCKPFHPEIYKSSKLYNE